MNRHIGNWDGDRLLKKSGVAATLPPTQLGWLAQKGTLTIDFTNLYLGIDHSRPRSVRIVCLDGSAIQSPWPIDCLTFKRATNFLAYVKSCVRDSGTLYVASCSAPSAISGPAIHYLEELEGISVTRLGPTERLHYEEAWDQLYEVETDYLLAFALALTAAYRYQASTVLDQLRFTAWEVEARIQSVASILNRLSQATRVPF